MVLLYPVSVSPCMQSRMSTESSNRQKRSHLSSMQISCLCAAGVDSACLLDPGWRTNVQEVMEGSKISDLSLSLSLSLDLSFFCECNKRLGRERLHPLLAGHHAGHCARYLTTLLRCNICPSLLSAYLEGQAKSASVHGACRHGTQQDT